MAINNQTLNAGLGTEGSGAPTVHEIFTKINNAKDKSQKIAVLKQFDNQAMRQLLKAAFDPKIKFDLPEGNPPYIKNEAPAGTEHTSLASEARKLYHFVVGGNNQITKLKKETMFIQMLEGLHGDDAEVLMAIKNKSLNNAYKGLTANLVKETFNWNDDFVRIAQ
tara:strand:- start:563 stop:1057 length:495 start_codon:yes stop_codon:yes gene_type:complete